ncbi:MAG: hypothetical protein RL885_32375 [Planctomycetota bacterium]
MTQSNHPNVVLVCSAITLLWVVPRAAAQSPIWLEAESAFEAGTVSGTQGPRHHMVTSRGYCVGDGWGSRAGDALRIPFELTESIPDAVLSLRYATGNGASVSLAVRVDRSGSTSAIERSVTLAGTEAFERFRVHQVALGELAAGAHSLELSLSSPREVWWDCFAVSGEDSIPELFTRQLVFDNLPGGHFTLVYSPHAQDESIAMREQVFDKLERQYALLREYLGTEPDRPLVCCVSAPEDAAGGPAHARGNVFFFQEPELFEETSGNMLHEMTHTFQDDFASNGFMPRWLREGEAFFLWGIGELDHYGRSVDELWAEPLADPERLRRVSLDEQGINVVQLFGTSWQPDGGRPYYALWNVVFRELLKHDRDVLRRMHERIRSEIASGTYPIAERDREDPFLVSATYVRYLIGDDPGTRDILEDWGFITWPEPERYARLGEEKLRVDCSVHLPENRNTPWRKDWDESRSAEGYSYEVSGLMCWRSGDEHQWFFGDSRFGDTALSLTVRVPTGFAGTLVLFPDARGRRMEVVLEREEIYEIRHERRFELPIREGMTSDGAISLQLRKLDGVNGALEGLALHAAPERGQRRLDVRCGRNVEILGQSLNWSPTLDVTEASSKDFGVQVLRGSAWGDGRSFQWFGHDRRVSNEPMRFEVRVPKRFAGDMSLTLDQGDRVQRVIVEGEAMFVGRGERELWIPLEPAWTENGKIEVAMRRIEGVNAAIQRVEIRER